MVTQLKTIQSRPKMSVDADLLVAQMEMLLGDEAATNEKFRTVESEAALDDLKKKMDGGA